MPKALRLSPIPSPPPPPPRSAASSLVRRYSSSIVCTSFSPLRRANSQPPKPSHVSLSRRSLAQLPAERSSSELWFTPTTPTLISRSDPRSGIGGIPGNDSDHKPPDERIVKLGKTLRILTSHLPSILVNPLPQEILSPNITLHLFPSTHPHLPTVKGRVAYRAALWTAPVAWGSVPIVGNVRLRIMSERMVRGGGMTKMDGRDPHSDEELVVRWVTEGGSSTSGAKGKASGAEMETFTPGDSGIQGQKNGNKNGSSATAASSNGVNRGLSTLLGGEAPIFKLGKEEQFTGIFIFSFDDEGRIASQTIEHADEGKGWDRTAKVVSLTDWLLRKARWGSRGPADPTPALAVETPSFESRGSMRFLP